MQDSVFTKIIKGEIPCHKVYEDGKTLAFMDIYPVQPGHVLVIPKVQIEFVWDLPDVEYDALMRTARMVALRQRDVLGVPYIHARIVGTDVPHAHVHLIPFSDVSQLKAEPDTAGEADHAALAAVASKLAIQ